MRIRLSISMPIQIKIQILPQVLQLLKGQNNFLTFIIIIFNNSGSKLKLGLALNLVDG
jgi:hypothetical protein